MYPDVTMYACLGLIITAIYCLVMLQKVLLGNVNPSVAKYPDINGREIITILPLVVITCVVGFYPKILLQFQEAAVASLVNFVK